MNNEDNFQHYQCHWLCVVKWWWRCYRSVGKGKHQCSIIVLICSDNSPFGSVFFSWPFLSLRGQSGTTTTSRKMFHQSPPILSASVSLLSTVLQSVASYMLVSTFDKCKLLSYHPLWCFHLRANQYFFSFPTSLPPLKCNLRAKHNRICCPLAICFWLRLSSHQPRLFRQTPTTSKHTSLVSVSLLSSHYFPHGLRLWFHFLGI